MTFPGAIYGDPTTVTTSLPSGTKLGQMLYDSANGKEYRMSKANASIPIGAGVKVDATQSDGNTVIATAAQGDPLAGVNDTGAIIPSGSYFWLTTMGNVTALVVTTIAAGVILAPSGTAGTLQAGAAAAVEVLRAITLVSSGAGGLTACRLLF